MSFSLSDDADDSIVVRPFVQEYHIESDGYRKEEPIVTIYCRDSDGNRVTVEVEGFYPSFYITEREFQEKIDQIMNEGRLRKIEAHERAIPSGYEHNSSIEKIESSEVFNRLDKTPCVRMYTIEPSHVRDLMDNFDWTGESDVFFTNRFMVSNEIKRGMKIPAGESRAEKSHRGSFDNRRVFADEIETTESVFDMEPRMLTVDIEVWAGDGFPEPEHARQPVTAITAHDNYSDEYWCGILKPWKDDNSWPDDEPVWDYPDNVDESSIEVEVFDKENALLATFFQFFENHQPDLATGWNSSRNDMGNGFDYPYLINRAQNLNERSKDKMSPEGDVFVTKRGSPVIGGVELFDMLQAYKKTQIHEKKSYSLEAIAQEELGRGKEEIDGLDYNWLHDPAKFLKYNIRDVEAVSLIEQSKGVLDMYDHIRSVAGASYSECADSNIGIIDMLFLRKAYENNIALPTSEKPIRGWYYGGRVFDPIPGKHTNVLYPDLASLYPYLMWSLNASPETYFDSLEEAKRAGYGKNDLYRGLIDRRDDDVKEDSMPEPLRKFEQGEDYGPNEEIFFIKPEVKEGFVRSVVDDMVDLKYEYKKDKYPDTQYGAVKRITNSLYGVFGDSSSYGTGFRLFDWKVAESVTVAGQIVVTHSANEFVERMKALGYTDTERVGGDTDSVMTSVPSLDVTPEEIQEDFERMESGLEPEVSFFQAAKWVNGTYDQLMRDVFWIDDPSMHKMEIEIESYADAIFFKRDFDADDPNKGVKKRYTQTITWDEGEIIENPKPDTTGFELVRSDTSKITGEMQEEVFQRILELDDPKDSVIEYLSELWNDATSGDISHEKIGIPKSVSGNLGDYGWSVKEVDKGETVRCYTGEVLDEEGQEYIKFFTAGPHIRGARFATEYIDGEDITSGDKPLFFYCDGVKPNGALPEVYEYDAELNHPTTKPCVNKPELKELGRTVDALSVNDAKNIPDEMRIDYEKMADKTIKSSVEDIVRTMGWDWGEIENGSSQTGLEQFM